MARPREFEETAALDAAVECFWARGYEGTSVRDLAEKMEMTSASLYNAFGDKHSLYRRALNHYVEQSVGDRVARIEARSAGRAAIGAFFEETVGQSLKDRQRKGCMVVNTALELAPHDPEFQKIVAGVLSEVEAFFRRCVTAGQRDGTITTSQSPEDLARLLLSVHLGIRVLARARPERALLEGLMRPVFALLDGQIFSKEPRFQ
jgi:TetR/AcrR family transcriptional regulator, transcriptional repressor for nem operon